MQLSGRLLNLRFPDGGGAAGFVVVPILGFRIGRLLLGVVADDCGLENSVDSANELVGYLQECGISAERRSIYRDIEEKNKALLLTTTDKYGIEVVDTIEDAEEMVKDDANKTIVKCRCLLKLFEILALIRSPALLRGLCLFCK